MVVLLIVVECVDEDIYKMKKKKLTIKNIIVILVGKYVIYLRLITFLTLLEKL